MTACTLLTLPFMVQSCEASQRPAVSRTIADWVEKVGTDREVKRLTIERTNREFGSTLKIEREDGLKPNVQRVTFSREQERSEIELAIPIAVIGSRSPQVLVRTYRPNWLDYRLYVVDDSGCRSQFSISVRDRRAIRWQRNGNALRSFTLFDRWASVPNGLRERKGHRWQRISTWRFGERGWVESSPKWTSYLVGSDPGGHEFSGADCPFRWKADTKTKADASRLRWLGLTPGAQLTCPPPAI